MSEHPLDTLAARGKEPPNRAAFNRWLSDAAERTGAAPGRLNRTVANTIVVSALQRAVHDDGESRFLVKGGTHLELRLGLETRASRDLDTLFRGAFEDMVEVLDDALREGWGPFALLREEFTEINVPHRRVKPRRTTVKVQLQGSTVLTAQLEVAADEGGAGARADAVSLPSLQYLGVESAERAAVLALEYQIAQKLHASTDPHSDDQPNLRVHDLADLKMLKDGFFPEGTDLSELRSACVDIFSARAAEAAATGETEPRSWPPTLEAHAHWTDGWTGIRDELGWDVSLEEVVAELNDWIAGIDQAGGA